MSKRHALSHEQWTAIRDLLPGKAGDPGRTAENNRLFVDAVLYVLKTGVPWEDLPSRFGKPNTVWKRFDRWCRRDVWRRVFQTLGEAGLEEELAEVCLDSSSVKAHPVASTGRRCRGEKKKRPTPDAVSAARGAG
jgi:putative transposase